MEWISVEQRGAQGGLWKIRPWGWLMLCCVLFSVQSLWSELICFELLLFNIHQVTQRKEFESIGLEIINQELDVSA